MGIQRINEQEFNEHLSLGFDDEEHHDQWTRLGIWINQWDNDFGVGILRLTNPNTGEIRYLSYE